MRKWFVIVASCVAWLGVFAAEQQIPELSLDDPYSQKWALLDNPVRLRDWARQQFTSIDPKVDPVHWAVAVATYIRSADNFTGTGETRQLLDQALDISRRETLPGDALFILRSAEIDRKLYEEFGFGAVLPPDRLDQQSREKIKLAEQLNLPGKKVFYTLHWGLFMLESGRESEGIKKIHEAMREAGTNPRGSDLDMMQAKETYAASLDTFGSKSKSKMIYRELEDFCAKHQLRWFCLMIDHDYAVAVDASDRAANLESVQILQNALLRAEALGDQSFIATISSSLMQVLDNVGQYDEARIHGLRALEIFKDLNYGVFVADTQLKLARVLIHLKQAEEALNLLTTASRSFPSDYYTDQADIAAQMAKAYKMLGKPRQAFEHLKTWAHALKENASRNQSAEIAKNLTQINMELEEDQSRSLTEAEHIQKTQETLDSTNRQEQQNTLLMINAIWVVSGLMIVSGVLGLIWIRQQNKRILRLNRHLREDILQRFLPPVIADRVAKGQSVLDEIPQEIQITALFGRLVGLEHAIEDLGPRVTARLLESLMQAVTDISLEHNGCLDKLHRGSFLILFGAPIQRPIEEQIQHAIEFAHSIQQRFHQIRDSWPAVEGWRPGIAIGIHQGPALVGVFGGKRRADYTAIGQTVNLAARIEGEAKAGEIMVSEKIAEALHEDACRPVGDVRLKGISKAQKLSIVDTTKIPRRQVPPAA